MSIRTSFKYYRHASRFCSVYLDKTVLLSLRCCTTPCPFPLRPQPDTARELSSELRHAAWQRMLTLVLCIKLENCVHLGKQGAY